MKRKILSDTDCMSGTGWMPDDAWHECPNCGENLMIKEGKSLVCKECKTKLKVEYGQLNLMRLTEEE